MNAINIIKVDRLLKTARKVSVDINGVYMDFIREENIFTLGDKEFTRDDVLLLIEVSKNATVDSVTFGEIGNSILYISLEREYMNITYNTEEEKAVVYKNAKKTIKLDKAGFRMACIRHKIDVFNI